MSEELNKIAKGTAGTDTAADVLLEIVQERASAAAASLATLENDNSDMISEKLPAKPAVDDAVTSPKQAVSGGLAVEKDSDDMLMKIVQARASAAAASRAESGGDANNEERWESIILSNCSAKQEWEPIDIISSNPDDAAPPFNDQEPRAVQQTPERIARHPTHAASIGQPGAFPVNGPGHCASSSRQGLQLLQEHDVSSTMFDSSFNTTLDAFVVQSGEQSNGNAHVERQGDIQEVVDGISMLSRRAKNGNGNRMTTKWFFPGIAFTLVLGCVVLVVVLVTQSKAKDTRSTTAPSQNVSDGYRYLPFRDDLNAATLKALKQGQDTPESRANVWMWKDPNLALYSEQRQKQRFALVATYYATQGDHWLHNTNWLDYEVSECQWFSKDAADPICDDRGMFLTLDLHSNNLTGNLPFNFWDTKAPKIDVSYNKIQGQLTALPADMDFLEYIDLSHNQFEGPIVGAPGFHSNNLLRIDLSDNCFSGNSGAVFRFMPKLQGYWMANNCIAREMTTHFQYTDIRELSFKNCRLFGSMPTEFGLLTHLQKMDYSGNVMLTGTLPSELNHLTSLLELDLTGTHFTGTFPETFCQRHSDGLLHIKANCSLMECC